MDTRKPYNGTRRALVLAFDVGTTFSGVSYAILEPGEIPKIHGVTRFPGQESVAGNSKIPTKVYYDLKGNLKAAGAEADAPSLADLAEDEGWLKAELFKLRLRPRSMKLKMNGMRLPPLPYNKTATDVFADFLGYLFRCTRTFVIETHANGQALWDNVERHLQFVLSHPNGWEGGQQSKMRRAAVLGGLIPDTDEGRSRVRFVTEGEASLHACVLNGLANDVLQNPSGHGFLVADAGGGTLDISSYAVRGTSPLVMEEIAPPDCVFAGSIFVSRRAREFLEVKLKDSKYGKPDTLDHITQRFDETTKRLFRDKKELAYIQFGSPLDKDLAVGIRHGQLKLTGNEVAAFFEPSIESAVESIKAQIDSTKGVVKSVWLVGGFANSAWLFTQLQERLSTSGVVVSRPDSATSKAVADGAIGFYCDHHVSARMSKHMYGVEFLREYDESDPDHVSRKDRMCELPSGPKLLADAFDCILARSVRVKESTTFVRKYCTEVTSLSTLSVFEVEIWCYRGPGTTVPKWINRSSEDFSTLCVVQADLSPLESSAQPRTGRGNKTYWTIVFSVEIHFGLTEFRARIKWVDSGKTRYGPATIVYNESGVRGDEDDFEAAQDAPEDDSSHAQDRFQYSRQTSRAPSRDESQPTPVAEQQVPVAVPPMQSSSRTSRTRSAVPSAAPSSSSRAAGTTRSRGIPPGIDIPTPGPITPSTSSGSAGRRIGEQLKDVWGSVPTTPSTVLSPSDPHPPVSVAATLAPVQEESGTRSRGVPTPRVPSPQPSVPPAPASAVPSKAVSQIYASAVPSRPGTAVQSRPPSQPAVPSAPHSHIYADAVPSQAPSVAVEPPPAPASVVPSRAASQIYTNVPSKAGSQRGAVPSKPPTQIYSSVPSPAGSVNAPPPGPPAGTHSRTPSRLQSQVPSRAPSAAADGPPAVSRGSTWGSKVPSPMVSRAPTATRSASPVPPPPAEEPALESVAEAPPPAPESEPVEEGEPVPEAPAAEPAAEPEPAAIPEPEPEPSKPSKPLTKAQQRKLEREKKAADTVSKKTSKAGTPAASKLPTRAPSPAPEEPPLEILEPPAAPEPEPPVEVPPVEEHVGHGGIPGGFGDEDDGPPPPPPPPAAEPLPEVSAAPEVEEPPPAPAWGSAASRAASKPGTRAPSVAQGKTPASKWGSAAPSVRAASPAPPPPPEKSASPQPNAEAGSGFPSFLNTSPGEEAGGFGLGGLLGGAAKKASGWGWGGFGGGASGQTSPNPQQEVPKKKIDTAWGAAAAPASAPAPAPVVGGSTWGGGGEETEEKADEGWGFGGANKGKGKGSAWGAMTNNNSGSLGGTGWNDTTSFFDNLGSDPSPAADQGATDPLHLDTAAGAGADEAPPISAVPSSALTDNFSRLTTPPGERADGAEDPAATEQKDDEKKDDEEDDWWNDSKKKKKGGKAGGAPAAANTGANTPAARGGKGKRGKR